MENPASSPAATPADAYTGDTANGASVTTPDTLVNALHFALNYLGGAVEPVAAVNATGYEVKTAVKISGNACYKLENTLNGVFKTLLVRATRQKEETWGLIALAAAHADPSARILVAQDNAHGAGALEKQMRRVWPEVQAIVKYKCRVLIVTAGEADQAQLQRWTEAAAIQKVKHNRGEFWSAPGVFSWDRPDAGSRLLLASLPDAMAGTVADLGCGNGLLSGAIARKEGVTALYAIDADARAVACCRLNLEERGAAIPFQVLWRDATADLSDLPPMDIVVTNPPFHTQQDEDRELGQKFCLNALKMLRSGGELYLVANRHMPYEAILENNARAVTLLADSEGFKVIRAQAR